MFVSKKLVCFGLLITQFSLSSPLLAATTEGIGLALERPAPCPSKKGLSIIIPAYNERLHIGRTIRHAREACTEVHIPFEILVVDDDSADETARIAEENGATKVIHVTNRHIGKNRNEGAKLAQFPNLLFLDADTTISPRDVARSLTLLSQGVSLVGSYAKFDSHFPFKDWACTSLMNLKAYWGTMPGGAGGICFMDKKTFEDIGGYSDKLFLYEDFDIFGRVPNKAFLHMDGYSSSRRFATQGVTLKRTIEVFLGISSKRKGTKSVDEWYKPNYRDICYDEEDLSKPRGCLERLFFWLCPERIPFQKKTL